MAEFIGYKPEEVNELTKTIAKSYETLGENMSEGWSTVSNVMQQNWKGMDEQDYESKLAARMVKLYQNCTELVNAMMQQMINLAESWQDYQNRNRLTGGDGGGVGAASFSFEMPTLMQYDMASIVRLKENAFSGEVLGLVNGGGSAIESSVSSYINDIKAKVQNIYDNITANTAFYGNQTQKIEEYIKAVGTAVAAVSTDVNDMYEAIAKLTTTGYEQADSTVASTMGNAASDATSAASNVSGPAGE